MQSGQVPNNEFVFKEGMADWMVASSCAELTSAPAMPRIRRRASTAPVAPMVPRSGTR
ncbi:MAG: DUF4339 domain-containing protein, partial [Leptolyngbyaceae cyanobacterium CSU_1_3]|nr:DUF4339 domain-containing protein [Leptolyngbyaceae cyanobacterium CSU_1_3]